MKKIIFALAACLTLTAACTDDDSTYATEGKNYINLGGIDESYSVVAFSGDRLNIEPTVESSYPDDDLEYSWAYYDIDRAQRTTYNQTTQKYEYVIPDTISHERNLVWSPEVVDGRYCLIFTATSKSTGLSQQLTTTLNASSALSRGFYILKEDADGNTDVDLYSTVSNRLMADVIRANQGHAIPGRPRWMDINHQMAYISPETGQAAGTNMICITTEDNEVRFIRASDCRTVMDQSNCHYEPVSGEIPYRTVRGMWSAFFLTNNGVYTCFTAGRGGSGILGALVGHGGSTHAVSTATSGYYSVIYWENATHSLATAFNNGTVSAVLTRVSGFATQNLNYDCIGCGLNQADGNVDYFLMQDRDDASLKYLYAITPGAYNNTLTSVRQVSPDTHFANASLRAICTASATVAYAVDGNRVYTYNLAADEAERELSFAGLPANEQITFISNRNFTGTPSFDYLVVGTQTADTYKLYFYSIVGGEPDGQPRLTITGQGKLKSLGYINPNVRDMTGSAAMPILDE